MPEPLGVMIPTPGKSNAIGTALISIIEERKSVLSFSFVD